MYDKGLKGYLAILKEYFYIFPNLMKFTVLTCHSKFLLGKPIPQTNSNIYLFFEQLLVSKFLINYLCYKIL